MFTPAADHPTILELTRYLEERLFPAAGDETGVPSDAVGADDALVVIDAMDAEDLLRMALNTPVEES
jgi:hypothetical protein